MGVGAVAVVSAPAKLTTSLRVTGVRHDGLHLIDAEMVSIDLADVLSFGEGAALHVVDEVPGALGVGAVPRGADNLVVRALRAVGREAAVRLVKRIPTGAGLGGGSADAAAVLRWAAVSDLVLAARLGADVPFCVSGGRARVTGIGEVLEPLPFVDRRFVVLMPPLRMDTAAVYRAWDERNAATASLAAQMSPAAIETSPTPAESRPPQHDARNDLESAALDLQPALAGWRDALGDLTGSRPRLAGSGAAWFVEGTPDELGLDGHDGLTVEGRRAPLVAVRTVPAVPVRST